MLGVGRKTLKADEKDAKLDELRELIAGDEAEEAPSTKTDRRGILKLAGGALLGAAGAMAVRAIPAAAASGDYMVTGCVNIETSTTQVSGSNTIVGLGAQGATGLQGSGNAATPANEIGVLGTGKSGTGTGVRGQITSGVGVDGIATTGTGVQGTATSGIAGHFTSTANGYDVLLGQAIVGTNADPHFHGTGRLAMVGRDDVGGSAPNIAPFFVTHSTLFAGGHFQHELIRGNDGSIWASTAALAGANQTRWKKINAVRVDTSDGLGGNFKPVRVIDTRITGGIRAASTLNTVTVAGFGAGNSNIPADAVAVMGNLTAVGYTGAGFLTIMPFGIALGTGAGQYNAAADPSSLNFILGQAAIANSFVCGLSAGKLQVYVGLASSYFIVDITAYLQ
jgi:hypothetical protein